MTPDQRMKLFKLIADYEDARTTQSGLAVLYEITAFIEELEYDAAAANVSWRDDAIDRKDRD